MFKIIELLNTTYMKIFNKSALFCNKPCKIRNKSIKG